MNTKKHSPNKGSFKRGQVDPRRNTSGQISKEGVALSALLKKHLIEEGSKPPPFGYDNAGQTKAEALAAQIWDLAIGGDFRFVQFLADRIMGKVKEEIDISQRDLRFEYGRTEALVEVVHTNEASKPALLAKDGKTA